MNAEALNDRSGSVSDAENWLPLGAGALLLLAGASQRSAIGACLAVSSAPLLYRGITGRWPDVLNGHTEANGTRATLGGERGVHVRESVRLEVPDRMRPNGQPDPGLLASPDPKTAADDFVAAIAKHRHLYRETDPSRLRG